MVLVYCEFFEDLILKVEQLCFNFCYASDKYLCYFFAGNDAMVLFLP